MTESTVIAQFDAVVARQPRKVCIYWGGDRFTNADLAGHIHRYGARLQAGYGVGRGDRVGILLKNCPEFIFALYAVLKSGATVVPINNFLKAPEIQHIVDDCRIKCLITSADFDETIAKLADITAIPLPELERGAATAAPTWPAVSPDDLAVIIYTSGTTGKSKGAMLTHGNIASNVGSCIKALEETSDDRLTLLLPMFHSFMLTVCIFTPLSMGAGIVLIRSVQPFKAAMREIIRNRATILVGIPQLFQALADAKIPFWLHWVLKLRLAVSGAAPLPGETLGKFDRKFHFPLLEGYGLSEASPVVSFNPIRGVQKPGSVGLPLPDIEVKIVRRPGTRASARPGWRNRRTRPERDARILQSPRGNRRGVAEQLAAHRRHGPQGRRRLHLHCGSRQRDAAGARDECVPPGNRRSPPSVS